VEIALGFVIAVAIALTGVGAGTLTAPLLMLLLGLPVKESVGTALLFGAAVKLLTAPVYVWRGQVNARALTYLIAGGLPGVLAGSFLLHVLRASMMMALLGFTIVTMALLNLFRSSSVPRRNRTHWLAAVGLPIGVEVGFSSAGSGALGALALLGLTPLSAVEVVGTDLCFGLALSIVGGGIHAAVGNLNTGVLLSLLIGGLPGGLTGALLASRVPSKQLRYGLSLAMVLLGAHICWKGVVGSW
jgi:uncharacterized membrane protein YfcA